MRDVRNEADQEAVEKFLAVTIPDRTRMRIPPRSLYRSLGLPNDVIAIDVQGQLVAAAHGSASIEDIVKFANDGEAEVAEYLSGRLYMVHSVATRADARRAGHARTLMAELEARAIGRGMEFMAGVVTLGTAATRLYKSCGFALLQGGAPLQLPTRMGTILLPQDDRRSAWFFKRL